MTESNFWNPVTRRLAFAETIALIIFLTKTKDLTSTYDAQAHMMFGSHYLLDWWAAVDNRWYLGFEVTTYPPVAHQLLALVTKPIHYFTSLSLFDSVSLAYLLISCALTLAFPYAVFRFSELFTPRRAAANAGIVAAVFSGWWTILSVFGQYPTFFAVVLTLFGAVFLHRYLIQPSASTGVLVILLTSLVPMTHHFSSISILFAAYAVVLVDTTRDVESLKSNLRRGVPVAVIAVVVAVAAIWPFIEFLLTSPSQPTIPHGSRSSWLEGNIRARRQFDYTLWSGGILLVALPASVWTARRNRAMVTALGFGLLFGVLSLGETTPLPSIVYGGLAETLTYYRFATWGGILILPVIGATVHRHLDAGRTNPIGTRVLVLAAIGAVIGASLLTSTAGIAPPNEPKSESIEAVGEFMESDQHYQWRYLALGLPTKLGGLGIASPHSQTIDGYYNTARESHRLPRLFNSGTSQLSSVKYQSEEARDTLRYYLKNNKKFNIRFVFSTDRYYADFLEDAEYEVLYNWDHLDMRVWYDPETEPFTEKKPAPVEGHTGYAWGIVPMVCLAGAIALRGKSIASKSELPPLEPIYSENVNVVRQLREWSRHPVFLVLLLVLLSAIAAGAGPGSILDDEPTPINPENERVVYYDFDNNSSQIQNRANSDYDGSASGGVQYIARESGRAVHFEDRFGRVKVYNSSSLSTGSPKTVEFMVKLEQRQNANVLGNYGSYWFWVSGNRIRFAVMSDGERIAEPSAEIPIGEWTRILGTYDTKDGARIFVDGNLVDSEQMSSKSLNQRSGPLTINMGGWEEGLNGSVDEFSVWNRSFSPTEVRTLQRTRETFIPNSPHFRLGLTLLIFLLIIGVTLYE